MARQYLILGLQAFSAIGIFALGLLTYFGQSGRDLRLEWKLAGQCGSAGPFGSA